MTIAEAQCDARLAAVARMLRAGAAARSTASNGMAATAHPLASQIAIDILKQGGSALDGAIAANAALGLMEPTGNGIGGDIFFIIWDPEDRAAIRLQRLRSGAAWVDHSLS